MLSAFALASATPVPSTPLRETTLGAAVQVIRKYYTAIGRHDFRTAYRLWHGARSYERFRSGYGETASVRFKPLPPFHAEGAAGSVYADIQVRVDAVLRSGRRQHFTGYYRLRRINDVEGATLAERHWHIVAAHLRAVPAGR